MKDWTTEEWSSDAFQHFVLIFHEREDNSYYARVMDEKEIGDILARAHYGDDVNPFTIWDADKDGRLVECIFEHEKLVFGENDYADLQSNIFNPDGEQVGTAFARIDGRA